MTDWKTVGKTYITARRNAGKDKSVSKAFNVEDPYLKNLKDSDDVPVGTQRTAATALVSVYMLTRIAGNAGAQAITPIETIVNRMVFRTAYQSLLPDNADYNALGTALGTVTITASDYSLDQDIEEIRKVINDCAAGFVEEASAIVAAAKKDLETVKALAPVAVTSSNACADTAKGARDEFQRLGNDWYAHQAAVAGGNSDYSKLVTAMSGKSVEDTVKTRLDAFGNGSDADKKAIAKAFGEIETSGGALIQAEKDLGQRVFDLYSQLTQYSDETILATKTDIIAKIQDRLSATPDLAAGIEEPIDLTNAKHLFELIRKFRTNAAHSDFALELEGALGKTDTAHAYRTAMENRLKKSKDFVKKEIFAGESLSSGGRSRRSRWKSE